MRDPFDDIWSASDVPDVRATLRIRGGDIDPDLVTQLLGVAPTALDMTDDGAAREWTYRLTAPEDTELGSAVEALLAVFSDDTTMWEELTSAYAVDVHCELTLRGAAQHTGVDPDVLAALGRRGLPLSLELRMGADDGG
jgi:hypothetical protein